MATGRNRLRRVLFLGTVIAGGMLVTAAAAYACTPSAAIEVEDKAGVLPAEKVQGVGKGFNATDAAGDVSVHFNSLSGDVVWTGSVADNGTIAFSFTVPEGAERGHYTITATQYLPGGQLVPGTPARDILKVIASPQTNVQAPPAPADPGFRPGARTGKAGTPQGGDAASQTADPAEGSVPFAPAMALPQAEAQTRPVRVTQRQPQLVTQQQAVRAERLVRSPTQEVSLGAPRETGTPTGAVRVAILMLAAGLVLTTGGLAFALAQMRTQKQATAPARIS